MMQASLGIHLAEVLPSSENFDRSLRAKWFSFLMVRFTRGAPPVSKSVDFTFGRAVVSVIIPV